MQNKSGLNLIESLRGRRELTSTMFGLATAALLFFSVWQFGKNGKFNGLSIVAYFVVFTLFLFLGAGAAVTNKWFARFFLFLNALIELLALGSWVWVLYLSQENPGGNYAVLAALDVSSYLLFLLFLFGPCTIGIVVSLRSWQKMKKG